MLLQLASACCNRAFLPVRPDRHAEASQVPLPTDIMRGHVQPSPEQQMRTDEEIARVVREAMLLPGAAPSGPARQAGLASKSTSGSSELESYDPMFEEAYEAETTNPEPQA